MFAQQFTASVDWLRERKYNYKKLTRYLTFLLVFIDSFFIHPSLELLPVLEPLER